MMDPDRLKAAKDLVDDRYYDQQSHLDDAYDAEMAEEVPRPADGHYAEETVVDAMARVEKLLGQVGLQLHGYSPGVSAYTERGKSVRFDYDAWVWLEELLVRHVEMRDFLWRTEQFLDANDAKRVQLIQDAEVRAREAHVELSKLRHLLAGALRVRGDEKGRSVVQILRDVAQWHRASGDSAVCESEAVALDLLADQLSGMGTDAAEKIDKRYFGEM